MLVTAHGTPPEISSLVREFIDCATLFMRSRPVLLMASGELEDDFGVANIKRRFWDIAVLKRNYLRFPAARLYFMKFSFRQRRRECAITLGKYSRYVLFESP